MVLSERQRIEILILLGCGDKIRSQAEVRDLFNAKYPENQISQGTVSKIFHKFEEHGTVQTLPKTGRARALNEEKKLDIALELVENPHTSTVSLARNHDASRTAIRMFLKQEKYHPYKVCLVQELLEDDYDRRLQFCEEMMRRCDDNNGFQRDVLFSDEATFYLNGVVNRHNYRFWSQENPHWTCESHTQHPQKVNVWAGIINNRILGPFFFEENLTAARYLDFLTFDLIPALAVIFPHEIDPDIPNERIWFQQDGAPPHFGIDVRRYLDEMFPNRWIGRRGTVEWPPRSPDLTPLDYFLWGYLKERVYQDRPDNIENLKNKIRAEMHNLPAEVIQNAVDSFYYRLGECQIVNGGHFQHLRH
uniref:Transposable element Tc1 transposase n=1 Tax=Anoplophora glabripennis TaxID=217634 RepID=V5I868_ANOGL